MNTERIVQIARAAHGMGADFPGYLSTGEAVTAALVLNRADWLKQLGYTLAEAVNRLDTGDADHLVEAQRALQSVGLRIEVRA
jgi:hypothetical protein